jgi:hypothetical protein
MIDNVAVSQDESVNAVNLNYGNRSDEADRQWLKRGVFIMHRVCVLRCSRSFETAMARIWQHVAIRLDLSNELKILRFTEPCLRTDEGLSSGIANGFSVMNF